MAENSEWEFFNGPREVEEAVDAALHEVGRRDLFFLARLGRMKAAGVLDPRCLELWCAQVKGIATEIRHCRGASEGHEDMVAKFVQTFRTLGLP